MEGAYKQYQQLKICHFLQRLDIMNNYNNWLGKCPVSLKKKWHPDFSNTHIMENIEDEAWPNT